MWIVLCVGFVGLLLVAEYIARSGGPRWGTWVAKPLASTCFVGYGLSAEHSPPALKAALILCWLGDVLLIPKGRKDTFLVGIIAFLLGHVAFAVGFWQVPVHQGAVALAALPLCLVGGGVWYSTRKDIPSTLLGAILAYIAVITVMVASAIGAVSAGSLPLWTALGAVAFALSDVSVALDRFKKLGFWNRAWGLPLYFAAQIILIYAWQLRA